MKSDQKQIRSDREGVRAFKQMHLGDTLEFSIEDMLRSLMTLTDVSIAIERERIRLGVVASGNKIAADEIRVIKALLNAFWRETDRLQTDAKEIEDILAAVLSEHGVNPLVPETWCQLSSRSRTRSNRTANR